MNPLDLRIEVPKQPASPLPGTKIMSIPPITPWGIFNPPHGMRRSFNFAKDLLALLVQYDGRTVGEVVAIVNNPSSYCYEKRPKNIVQKLSKLHSMGAIDVKGDRMILRREVPTALELLARATDD